MAVKSKVQKLADRLKAELDIEIDVSTFRRVYAGHWQRSSGAWSWSVSRMGIKSNQVGSQYSVTELLKSAKLEDYYSGGDTAIDPVLKDEGNL